MWTAVIACSLVFAGGLLFGWLFRDLYDMVDDLYQDHFKASLDKPALGPTLGSYADPQEAKKPTVHVVNPKSPVELEWERQNKTPDLMKPKG